MPTVEDILGPRPAAELSDEQDDGLPGVADILGPKPRVVDILGPRPASQYERETFGQPVIITPDDNLARAARDFQTENARFPARVSPPDVTFEPGVLAGGVADMTPEEMARNRMALGTATVMDTPVVPIGSMLKKLGEAQAGNAPGEAVGGPFAQGVDQTMEETLNGLTTPKNLSYMLASVGAASSSRNAARMVAALWTGIMGAQAVQDAPELARRIGNELGKPEEQRDYSQIGSDLSALGVETLFTSLPAVHMVGEPAAKLIGQRLGANVRSSEFLGPSQVESQAIQGPDMGYVEPGERMPGPEPIPIKPPVEPKAQTARLAGSNFRPEVPETPPEAERDVPVLAEIRKADARTIGEIQDLFPKRQLSREEARDLRNAAWGATTSERPEPRIPTRPINETPAEFQQRSEHFRKTGEVLPPPAAVPDVPETLAAPLEPERVLQQQLDEELGQTEAPKEPAEAPEKSETSTSSIQPEVENAAPGANVERVSSAQRPETPVEAVSQAEEHVGEVAKTEGQRPAREVKSELVARLEKALAKAPSLDTVLEGKTFEAWSKGAKRFKGPRPLAAVYRGEFEVDKPGQVAAAVAAGLEEAKAKKVIIDIPGDGQFKIWNIKEPLEAVLKRANKIRTDAGKGAAPRGPAAGRSLNEARAALDRARQQAKPGETVEQIWERQYRELLAKFKNEGGTSNVGRLLEAARRGGMAGYGEKEIASDLAQTGSAPHNIEYALRQTRKGVERQSVKAPATGAGVPESRGTAEQPKTGPQGANPFFDRESETLGVGRPSTAPTVEDVRRQRASAREQRQVETTLRTREQGNGELPKAASSLDAGTAPARGKMFLGMRRIFAPGTISEDGAHMEGIIRFALGQEFERQRQADFDLRPFRKEFDKTPVARNWSYVEGEPLPRNYAVMRAIDTGEVEGLTPVERQFASVMRRLFDDAIDMVQKVSPNSLRDLIENYFPRIWAEPEKNADKLNRLLARRPWEGPKSFLKKRVLEYFTEGLQMGLRPVSDNPVDVTIQKLGEMYRYATTRGAIDEARAAGYRKFVYIYEEKPQGWVKVADPSSDVFAPPTVTVAEAYDAQVRAKTLELLKALGVPHERLVDIGGERWGYAVKGQGNIVSKFAGPDSVLWHEFGHQMDWRYPELRKRLGASSPNSKIGKQLAALADLRIEGQGETTPGFKRYLRKAEEKLANVFDGYIRAPEKFRAAAPLVWEEFNAFLNEHPELKVPMDQIRPSLTLGAGTAEKFVGGPVLLGHWYMPEGAAQVLHNYLSPGLGKYKWFRGLRDIASLQSGVQLLGFFHGQFVMNDSFYSSLGLALYDLMKGEPMRGLKELGRAPIGPLLSLVEGHRMMKAIANPAGSTTKYRDLGRLAVEQNLRAGHGNFEPQFGRRWQRAFNELRATPSTGAAWETLWRAPLGGLELAMKPVMSGLVPRMKLGIFARMAERALADLPEDADLHTRRKALAQAADSTEDRLGQITYDNLFQNRTLKDVGQLELRAFGWQLTKYRMILGGLGDWTKAGAAMVQGQKPEVTFRMAYLPAMVMGHALIGGLLQYALTGKPPQKLMDYLFPETGLVDAMGRPVRVAIADFVKDVVADVVSASHGLKAMGAEWSRKLAPFWNMASEMYRNEDFWGTKIFSDPQLGEPKLDHVMKVLSEGVQYMGKTDLPFSTRAGQRFAEAGGGKLGWVAPWLGYVPAPRYATQSPAEARAAEIMRESGPREARSKQASAKAQAEAELVRDLRTGKVNDQGQFMARARAAGEKTQADLTRIQQRVLWTPMQYQVHKMTPDQAMEVWDLAKDNERVSLAPFVAEKIQRAWDSKRMDDATAKRYAELVRPYYWRAKQAQAAAQQQANPKAEGRSPNY